MTSRPVISVFNHNGDNSIVATIPVPAVLKAPVRADIVQHVHACMAKNKRQAYAVSEKAGHQTSAESWGTGRAVARIPRVSGGGTHRAGQAAFGNMCRGGRMFAPTKTWRRWHVKINQTQKRHATAAAVAATAVPPLVLARGHRIGQIQEVPLVVGNEIESFTKTKQAVALLKAIKAYEDVEKAMKKKLRAGKGKLRNRRHKQRRGPLVIYGEDKGITRAFRGIPGLELCNVNSLNLLKLAPGGHVGRFCIWTQSAFSKLDTIFGTFEKASQVKKDYTLPISMVTNPDITRVINSDEVQSALRPAQEASQKRPFSQRKNPLKNMGVLVRLNPYAQVVRRRDMLNQEAVAGGKSKTTKRSKVSGTVNKAYAESILEEN